MRTAIFYNGIESILIFSLVRKRMYLSVETIHKHLGVKGYHYLQCTIKWFEETNKKNVIKWNKMLTTGEMVRWRALFFVVWNYFKIKFRSVCVCVWCPSISSCPHWMALHTPWVLYSSLGSTGPDYSNNVQTVLLASFPPSFCLTSTQRLVTFLKYKCDDVTPLP